MHPLCRNAALFQLRAPVRRHLYRRQFWRAHHQNPPRIPHNLRCRFVHHLWQIGHNKLIPPLQEPKQLDVLGPRLQRPAPRRVRQQEVHTKRSFIVVPPRQVGQFPGVLQRRRHATLRLQVQQNRKNPAAPVPLQQHHFPPEILRQRRRRMQRHRRCATPRLRRKHRQYVPVRNRPVPVDSFVHDALQILRRKRRPQQISNPSLRKHLLLMVRPIFREPHRQHPQIVRI